MEAERETETEAERVKVLEGDPARAKDLREAEACGSSQAGRLGCRARGGPGGARPLCSVIAGVPRSTSGLDKHLCLGGLGRESGRDRSLVGTTCPHPGLGTSHSSFPEVVTGGGGRGLEDDGRPRGGARPPLWERRPDVPRSPEPSRLLSLRQARLPARGSWA